MLDKIMKNNYTNLFLYYGYDQKEIDQRLENIINTCFYGSDDERIYHEAPDGMGYMVDTGNMDVRTEGMSYGMMIAVQLDKKDLFDRIWKWTKTYMWMSDGENKGYFAWSCGLDGSKNAMGPAPDGEEYFAMALFFASNRWGDGDGIFNYGKEARDILHECVHKGEDGIGQPMWEPSNKLIKFITNCDFTDPSYHLPHFYELFAYWANEEDREFFKEAAKNSREYLKKACHAETGLAAEYAEYDGKPFTRYKKGGRHDWYYSDSYRVPANLALDYEWFAADEWECENLRKIQRFFKETADMNDLKIYEIDGKVIDKPALHPVAIIATNAMASLGCYKTGEYSREFVELFWNTPLRKGDRRYYDNCLYMFAFLALSGNFRIW